MRHVLKGVYTRAHQKEVAVPLKVSSHWLLYKKSHQLFIQEYTVDCQFNLLLLNKPGLFGCGKSQVLNCSEELVPREIYSPSVRVKSTSNNGIEKETSYSTNVVSGRKIQFATNQNCLSDYGLGLHK